MKTILMFNLPKDADELYNAQKGLDFKCVLWDLDNWLRNMVKYENIESVDPQDVRKKIYDLLDEYDAKIIN
jgi:hypothetical protein